MFKEKVFKEMVAIIGDLQKVSDPEHFRGETLSSLETLFKASDSVILDWTPFKQGARYLSTDDMFFHSVGNQVNWDYPLVHDQDPIFDWIESGRCHADFCATRLSDLARFRDLKKTEFYSEILAPLNCRHVLTMATHRGDSIEASISMIRPPNSKDFSDSEVQLARVITPVLANAYSHILLKRESELNEDLIAILATQIQQKPFILFSSNLEGVYRSEQMTALGRQLWNFGDSIKDIFSKSDAIEHYIDTFTSNNTAQHKRLPETLSDTVNIGRKKMIHIELQAFTLPPRKRYLMATLTVTNANKPKDNLQRYYGLTMREYQIAQMAAKGSSSHVVGQALAISPWSVKNHLKNIYKKTGVNNRGALAQIVNKVA